MASDSSLGPLIQALERTVLLHPAELPCFFPSSRPCPNLGLYVWDGLTLCLPHFNDLTRGYSPLARKQLGAPAPGGNGAL